MVTVGLIQRRARDLRRRMTPPEVALWQALRDRRCAGLRFRRQHPLGPWILDFYCADLRLAVEVDGESHAMGDPDYDARRDADLARRGVRVLRVSTTAAMKQIDGVLASVRLAAGA